MAKILLVDDSKALRVQFGDILRKAGHEVLEAENGTQGIQMVRENNDFQLIFADYNMPGIDGLTMCAKIKELDEGKNVPIFMLTTESSPKLMASGKEIGVMAWIMKPLNKVKVLNVIKKVVGE